MASNREDPGLPIKFGPCSNGEFVPPPLSAVEREAIRRARADCDANARSVGMSRRQFLYTASATRLWRTREPSFSRSSRKLTFLRETALYSFTGTFKSPKLIDPLQIALGIVFNHETVVGDRSHRYRSVSQVSASSSVPGCPRNESCGGRRGTAACRAGQLAPIAVQHQPIGRGNAESPMDPGLNWRETSAAVLICLS